METHHRTTFEAVERFFAQLGPTPMARQSPFDSRKRHAKSLEPTPRNSSAAHKLFDELVLMRTPVRFQTIASKTEPVGRSRRLRLSRYSGQNSSLVIRTNRQLSVTVLDPVSRRVSWASRRTPILTLGCCCSCSSTGPA